MIELEDKESCICKKYGSTPKECQEILQSEATKPIPDLRDYI